MRSSIGEMVLKYWLEADWKGLLALQTKEQDSISSNYEVLLFIASAYQHIGDYVNSKKYFLKSLKLGGSIREVSEICLVDQNNTKAKIFALLDDTSASNQYFDLATRQTILSDKNISVSRSRTVTELISLGLMEQGKKSLVEKLESCVESEKKKENIDDKLVIINTELELITHELRLSQERLQLHKNEAYYTNDQSLSSLKQRSVSQLGQDIWVLEKTNFKKDGFFVEFGATDGVLLSNTYLLEKEFCWKGICAEPNPKFYKELEKTRNCQVSNDCISGKTGEKVEFVFAQEYGGMIKHVADDMHAEKRKAYQNTGNVATLETISLDDFLEKMNAPENIDYLSIDTEGSEYDILSVFPFDKWEIGLITVEHNYTDQRAKIFNLLNVLGYERIERKFDDWYYKV